MTDESAAAIREEIRRLADVVAGLREDLAKRPAAAATPRAAAPKHTTTGGEGLTFPFGRSKGVPIKGAPVADLEWMREYLLAQDNSGKPEWMARKNAALIAALDEELGEGGRAATGGGSPAVPSDSDDSDMPF